VSQELVNTYIANCADFEKVVRSIGANDLSRIAKEGEWSAAYVIHHMADADMHFATRFLHILTVDKPAIVPFDEDVYPDRLQYEKRDPLASLAAIEAIQLAIANILGTIPESDWSRTSMHPESGLVTLADLFAMDTRHSKSHAGQLQEIINAL
jgi:hypothetical protein